MTVEGGSTLDLNNTTITGGTLVNAGTVDVTGGSTSTLNGVGCHQHAAARFRSIAARRWILADTTITGGTLNNFGTVNSTGTSALNGVGVTNSGLLEATSGTLTIDPSQYHEHRHA